MRDLLPRIFFDLDGTLCTTPPGTDYDDIQDLLAKCTPRPHVLARLKELHGLGHQLGIITARGPHVKAATDEQLWLWLGDRADQLRVHHRPRLLYDARHYVGDKEASLRSEHADVYIGDRTEDRAAALRAGAQFLWDHEFEAHGLASLRTVPA